MPNQGSLKPATDRRYSFATMNAMSRLCIRECHVSQAAAHLMDDITSREGYHRVAIDENARHPPRRQIWRDDHCVPAQAPFETDLADSPV